MNAMRGEVVYIYAFDLAYDTKRREIPTILGCRTHSYEAGPGKPGPRHGFFYRPQMVTLPARRCQSPFGPVEVAEAVKLFDVGAISVQVCVPFEVSAIKDLVRYYRLTLDGRKVEDEAMAVAERVRRELEPYVIRPVPELTPGEDYTIFCVHLLSGPSPVTLRRSEDWLAEHRRAVAGLLTQEMDAARLSQQEAAESTERYLSYYESDLVVVDWDAALAMGEPDSLEEVIHVAELANVQLAELGAYDRVLDTALELAYRDLSHAQRGRRQIRRDLREIRVDMARLNDELQNITKFFGDWHLAKIYQNLSGRFHLANWHGIINVKLRTLADLYQLLYQDRINSWMVLLELTIVLLFILDVILLLLGL
ncbi:MAG: hypothetical protein JW993_20120 [Sedimentisphaerales bacterium]|nr:hypothetical protein [Sedimentisphaerales bacterium]